MADRAHHAVTQYELLALEYRLPVKRDDRGYVTDFTLHRKGSVVSITDEADAARLLKAGAIALLEEADAQETVPVEETETPADVPAQEPAKVLTEEPAKEPAVEMKKPSKNDLVAEWEKWALAHGADPELVKEASKADLIELYG